jgi:hypothetical protein
MAGFPLLLFAFMILRFRKLGFGAVLVCVGLVVLAFYLGNVGYHQRGLYKPGIESFLNAAVVGGRAASVPSSAAIIIDPNMNTLDAVAPFTRRVEARYASRETPGLDFLGVFLLNINPAPSGLLDPGSIGVDLATYMRTTGSTGLTSPALADVYYAFGYAGLIVLAILGTVLGFFDLYAVRRPGLTSNLAILLAVIGTGVSLHSGIRAWTRPLFYAALMILIVWYLTRKRDKTERSGIQMNVTYLK